MRKSKPLELTYEKDDIDYKIYIFQGRAGKYEFKTIKAVTVALRLEDRPSDIRTYYPGVSACSGRDEFNVNAGIIKAAGRSDSDYIRRYNDDLFFDGLLNMATYHATETAKRIDKRNIERRKKGPFKSSCELAKVNFCAKGICSWVGHPKEDFNK